MEERYENIQRMGSTSKESYRERYRLSVRSKQKEE